MYDEAIAVQEKIRVPHDLIFNLLNASTLAIVRQNLASARQRLLAVMRLMREVPRGMSDPAPPLQTSGSYLAACGDWQHAAVLFGAAERQRELCGRTLERADQLYSVPLVEKTCSALGETQFKAAWAEGRGLSANDGVTKAQDWLTGENAAFRSST